MIDRQSKKRRRDQPEETTIGFFTVELYVNGLVDLWHQQRNAGANAEPHPRSEHIISLLKNLKVKQAAKAHADCQDKSAGTTIDGYDSQFLVRLSSHFLGQGNSIGDRSLLAQLIGHQCLFRGKNIRALELSDISILRLSDREGFSPAYILALSTRQSKSNRTGRVEFTGALRHREPLSCVHFALALYLFHR